MTTNLSELLYYLLAGIVLLAVVFLTRKLFHPTRELSLLLYSVSGIIYLSALLGFLFPSAFLPIMIVAAVIFVCFYAFLLFSVRKQVRKEEDTRGEK